MAAPALLCNVPLCLLVATQESALGLGLEDTERGGKVLVLREGSGRRGGQGARIL